MLQVAALLGFESPQTLQTRLAGRGALHTLSITALPGLGALQALLIKALLGLGTCWSWNVSTAASYNVCSICWFWSLLDAVNGDVVLFWNAS